MRGMDLVYGDGGKAGGWVFGDAASGDGRSGDEEIMSPDGRSSVRRSRRGWSDWLATDLEEVVVESTGGEVSCGGVGDGGRSGVDGGGNGVDEYEGRVGGGRAVGGADCGREGVGDGG